MEMSAKVVYTEDKQEFQKQFGCMNGIFQLFDRRYLLGHRRHGQNQKKIKLIQGQSDDGKNKFNNAPPEKHEEKIANKAMKEKHQASVESSRNSFSSSCSSTTFSSLDCSKRVQTEHSSLCQSIWSEPSSPTLQKRPDSSLPEPDIRDVVKDSMSRKPRVVSVKPVSKHERMGPAMTHVDSPRPLQSLKPNPYQRKDRNLIKLREISFGVKDIKETSRFSCDDRESPYKLKYIGNVKELPRLSLDSKQSSIKNRGQTHEPGVVARLMGLETVSPLVRNGPGSPQRGMGNLNTRIPLEPAPWKQPIKNKKALEPSDQAVHSVYGEIEKRLTDLEFKTSGKDLRALKQILEAMQRTRMRLENKKQDFDNSVKPVSPTIKKVVKPVNITSGSVMIVGTRKVKKVNRDDGREYPTGKRSGRNLTPKATGRCLSPRLHRSKNGIDKQSVRGPLSDSNRVRKQSNGQPTGSDPKSKSSKTMSINGTHTRNLSQDGDTVSFPSESNTSAGSENGPEVTRTEWARENKPNETHKKKFAERLVESKPMAELAGITMEQPSPVSVLDAFYTEDTLSPVKNKSYAFNDEEDLNFEEPEWNQEGIDNLVSSTELDEFNHVKIEKVKHPIHQIELLNSRNDEDHRYITEILLASGFLKNLDCATMIVHLHPTGSLINPELFHILEKTKTNASSKSNEKIRRKMVFDTVNDILVQILSTSASSRLWTNKRKGRTLNREKLLTELCSEINNLEANTATGLYDEIINIITADVNKKSEDWDEYCNEVPVMVLDIERLIFKDLISEVVNDEITGLQDWPGRHCRELFPV